MASKKQCSALQESAKPALAPVPSPRSSQDVGLLLQYAAAKGLANTKLVAHLSEMGALYPTEMLDAYRAFQSKQAGSN
jgi:hypothetical protein